MIPVLLQVGPIRIYSYGLMVALAFLTGDVVLASEFKRRGYDPQKASSVVLWAAVFSLLGARLNDIVDNLPAYMADPKSMLLSGAGFVYYGGFIAGTATIYVLARRFKMPFLRLADMAAPALVLGHAIGRVGCQLAGDGDWGMVSTLPWAMAYPRAIVGWNSQTVLGLDSHGELVSAFHPSVRVHPAPLYETILYLGVFIVLWSARKRIRTDGRVFYLFLMLAGASRFMVEFIRVNPRLLLGLSEAQLVSTAMLAIGAGGWLLSGARHPAAAARRTAEA